MRLVRWVERVLDDRNDGDWLAVEQPTPHKPERVPFAFAFGQRLGCRNVEAILDCVLNDVQAKIRLRRELAILIECVAPPGIVRERLANDAQSNTHSAADRGPELYDRIAASAEPIEMAQLVVQTHPGPPEAALTECLAWIAST